MRLSARLLLPLSLVASAQATLYEVTVGKNGLLKFVPDTVKAKAGDTIRYSFYAKVSTSSSHEKSSPAYMFRTTPWPYQALKNHASP